MTQSIINISWSPLPLAEDDQAYNVTVTDRDIMTLTRISEPYYVFNAPDHVLPCEVYNFSVTATYVGATYTGPSCSKPSPVISRMLPSLPDIKGLESSLIYSIIKESMKVTLKVFFEVSF